MAFTTRDIDTIATRIKEKDTVTMWQDFYVEAAPFSKVSGYFNDFHSYIADEWTVTEVGTSLQKLLDARNGVLTLVTGGTEDDGNNLQLGGTADSETVGECFLPASGKNLWFETSIASPAWTQHEVFFGLMVQDTSAAASLGSDHIGFTSADGSAVVNAVTSASSVATTVAAVVTPTDGAGTFYKFGFKVTGLDKIEFYVNNAIVATVTTNIPSTEMKLTFSHTAGDGNARTLNIDYVAVAQDR